MACFSRDILRACVRNTELAQKSDLENDFLLTEFETKSSGFLDFNGSSEFGLGIYVKDLKKNVRVAKESLKMFEKMLASDSERSFTEKVIPNEVINVSNNNLYNLKKYISNRYSSLSVLSIWSDLHNASQCNQTSIVNLYKSK